MVRATKRIKPKPNEKKENERRYIIDTCTPPPSTIRDEFSFPRGFFFVLFWAGIGA